VVAVPFYIAFLERDRGADRRPGSLLGRNADRLLLSPRHAPTPIDLHSLAASAGTTWANAFTSELRAQRRVICGGWPGTMTEARSRVLLAIGGEARTLSPDRLQELARTANRAARVIWDDASVREPDPGGWDE
jgi:hypothetical protein